MKFYAKSESVRKPSLVALTLDKNVGYGSADGEPTDLFLMIASPNDGDAIWR